MVTNTTQAPSTKASQRTACRLSARSMARLSTSQTPNNSNTPPSKSSTKTVLQAHSGSSEAADDFKASIPAEATTLTSTLRTRRCHYTTSFEQLPRRSSQQARRKPDVQLSFPLYRICCVRQTKVTTATDPMPSAGAWCTLLPSSYFISDPTYHTFLEQSTNPAFDPIWSLFDCHQLLFTQALHIFFG